MLARGVQVSRLSKGASKGEGVHFFQVSGLLVQSDIDLPHLIAAAPHACSPDVTIRQVRAPDALPHVLPGAVERGPTWQMAGELFLLWIPGVGRFLLREGREIAFETEDGAAPEDVAIFLIGTVFGILLHQRRQVVLHASAVRVGDRAVLFCGISGAGKSTLAAALGLEGYPLLNDDVCAIGLDPSGLPVAHADGRRLKLWAEAISNLSLADSRRDAVRSRFQKYYVAPAASSAESLAVGAVYALREMRPPLEAGIERCNPVDAALLIRRNAYRPRLIEPMKQSAHYFQSAVSIAAHAGVFFLTRPLDFAGMPEVIGQLRRHWLEIGLAGAPA